MSKVTSIEEFATRISFAATYTDGQGTDYDFTLEEYTNHDTGQYDHEITWIDNEPEDVDEDDIVHMFYEGLTDQVKNQNKII